MNTALLIWGYLAVGNFIDGFGLLLTISIPVCCAAHAAWYGECYHKDEERVYKSLVRWMRVLVPMVVFVGILACLYPDRDELAWILGGAAAFEVAQMPEAQQLPVNVLNAMNAFLEGIAEE